MKLKLTILLATLAVASQPLWAAEIDPSKLPPASDKKDLTYEKDIQPILKESCFGCHGEQRQSGRIRLDSLEAINRGGQRGSKIVIAGKAETSQLLISASRLDPRTAMPPPPRAPRGGMNRGTNAPAGTNAPGAGETAATPAMPATPPPGRGGPPAKPLTPEQVGLLRAWIDQGAK